jgi:hypothetical protein
MGAQNHSGVAADVRALPSPYCAVVVLGKGVEDETISALGHDLLRAYPLQVDFFGAKAGEAERLLDDAIVASGIEDRPEMKQTDSVILTTSEQEIDPQTVLFQLLVLAQSYGRAPSEDNGTAMLLCIDAEPHTSQILSLLQNPENALDLYLDRND